jgi:hypothetical protein
MRTLQLLVVSLTLAVFVPSVLQAQQSEIPTDPQADSAKANETPPQRVVEGRPSTYSAKRYLHPFTWLYYTVRPFLDVAEKVGPHDQTDTPRISGIKMRLTALGPGSGFGPEIKPFHNDVFHSNLTVEVPLVLTTKLYESFGFRAAYPVAATGRTDRLSLDVSGNYGSRPSENFFGIGNDTDVANHTQFRSVTRTAAVGFDTRLTETWTAHVEARYRNIGITEPRNFPSTQAVVSQNLPGLKTGATLRSLGAALVFDTRDRKRFAGEGTLQRLEASVNESARQDDFSYWRFHYDAQHFFPLTQDRRTVIGLRAEVETNREKGGSSIPFFDLPTIGNPDALPGFEPRRFADKSVVDYSAEYRYRIWRYFDWALFVSQGQVAPQIGDFGWKRFHTGYGMRFLVRSNGDHAIAVDVGHSREGWTLYLNFSPSF